MKFYRFKKNNLIYEGFSTLNLNIDNYSKPVVTKMKVETAKITQSLNAGECSKQLTQSLNAAECSKQITQSLNAGECSKQITQSLNVGECSKLLTQSLNVDEYSKQLTKFAVFKNIESKILYKLFRISYL